MLCLLVCLLYTVTGMSVIPVDTLVGTKALPTTTILQVQLIDTSLPILEAPWLKKNKPLLRPAAAGENSMCHHSVQTKWGHLSEGLLLLGHLMRF